MDRRIYIRYRDNNLFVAAFRGTRHDVGGEDMEPFTKTTLLSILVCTMMTCCALWGYRYWNGYSVPVDDPYQDYWHAQQIVTGLSEDFRLVGGKLAGMGDCRSHGEANKRQPVLLMLYNNHPADSADGRITLTLTCDPTSKALNFVVISDRNLSNGDSPLASRILDALKTRVTNQFGNRRQVQKIGYRTPNDFFAP